MDFRRKLFFQKNPYDLKKSKKYFANAIKRKAAFHAQNCPDYRRILKSFNFSPNVIDSEEMLYISVGIQYASFECYYR